MNALKRKWRVIAVSLGLAVLLGLLLHPVCFVVMPLIGGLTITYKHLQLRKIRREILLDEGDTLVGLYPGQFGTPLAEIRVHDTHQVEYHPVAWTSQGRRIVYETRLTREQFESRLR